MIGNLSLKTLVSLVRIVNKQNQYTRTLHKDLHRNTQTHPKLDILTSRGLYTMDASRTSGDLQRDKKPNNHLSETEVSQNRSSSSTPDADHEVKDCNYNIKRQQNRSQREIQNQHPTVTIRANEPNQQQPAIINQSITKMNQQNIIASVERPPSILHPPKQNNSTSSLNAEDTTSDSSASQNNHESATANEVIISQLQQIQSPSPHDASLQERESRTMVPTSTQIAKSRHRGFLSQLLCCFRSTSSTVYIKPTNEELNRGHINTINRIYDDVKQDPNYWASAIALSRQNGRKFLLPARKPYDNRICLVIDLDETLVHSSFKPIENANFIVPVEIDGALHKVYVLKRPHVDEFLKRVGQLYECVLFTASLAKYADPVADLLDPENIFTARLFRESCAFYRGNYVKDLSRLGRDLDRVIIVDNSPASYIFHPNNALPVTSYFDDENDVELLNLIPVLERIATNTGSVVPLSTVCHND